MRVFASFCVPFSAPLPMIITDGSIRSMELFGFACQPHPRVITTRGRFPHSHKRAVNLYSKRVFFKILLRATPVEALSAVPMRRVLNSNLGRFVIVRYERLSSITVMNVIKQAATSHRSLCAAHSLYWSQ